MRTVEIGLLLFCSACVMGASIPDLDREVVTLTTDDSGAPRARRIWFAALDGNLYIRTTPRAKWGANVQRDRSVTLVSREQQYAFAATRIEDARKLDQIHARFREKYGVNDWWADRIRFFFGGKITFLLTPLEKDPSSRPTHLELGR